MIFELFNCNEYWIICFIISGLAPYLKNSLKTSATVFSPEIYNCFTFWSFPDETIFSMDLILDLDLFCKCRFHYFPKHFLITNVWLILLENLFFAFFTQKLLCSLYAFWFMSLIEFENLFLRRLFFMISLLIFVVIKDACFSRVRQTISLKDLYCKRLFALLFCEFFL